jgi:hypothetical protein
MYDTRHAIRVRVPPQAAEYEYDGRITRTPRFTEVVFESVLSASALKSFASCGEIPTKKSEDTYKSRAEHFWPYLLPHLPGMVTLSSTRPVAADLFST